MFGFDYDYHPDYRAKVDALIAAADSTEQFVDLFLADESLRATHAYAELIKRERPRSRLSVIRQMFGDRAFPAVSDAGSVKLGSDAFTVLIPHGRGDGDARVAVFGKEDSFNESLMDFFTIVSGADFAVYYADCGDDVSVRLSGRYAVYTHQGLVALKQLD